MVITVAVDFDGVIHKYSLGWHDGTVYDAPVPGALESIHKLLDNGFAVYIHTTREPWQVIKWFRSVCDEMPFEVGEINDDRDFWNRTDMVAVTNRKLPAVAYVDDRAIPFKNDWSEIMYQLVGDELPNDGWTSVQELRRKRGGYPNGASQKIRETCFEFTNKCYKRILDMTCKCIGHKWVYVYPSLVNSNISDGNIIGRTCNRCNKLQLYKDGKWINEEDY